MSAVNAAGLVVALAVFAYLLFALVRGERL